MSEELKELIDWVFLKTQGLKNKQDNEGYYFSQPKPEKPKTKEEENKSKFKEELDLYLQTSTTQKKKLLELCRAINGTSFNPLMCRVKEEEDSFEIRFSLVPNDIIKAEKETKKRLENYDWSSSN